MSSSKRVKSQLIKDNSERGIDLSDDENEIDVPKRASDEVLSRRKIIAFKPKMLSKQADLVTPNNTPKASTPDVSNTAPSNPFATFKPSSLPKTPGSATSNGVPLTTAGTPNAFGFLKKSTTPLASVTSTSVTSASSSSNANKANQIKSLNAKFLESISATLKKNPVADLSSAADNYLKYYTQISDGKIAPITNTLVSNSTSATASETDSPPVKPQAVVPTQKTFPTFNPAPINNKPAPSIPVAAPVPAPTKPVPTEAEADSDSDSDEEIKIQGPSFKLAPTELPKSKNYGFVFGKEVTSTIDSDDDPEDEIEIKGPSFSLAGGNSQVKDPVFKFPVSKSSTPVADDKKPAASANQAVQSNGFSFGAPATTEATDKPAFSFGTTPASQTKDDKPTFSFGSASTSTSATAPTTSGFSFGAPASTDKKDDKPATSGFTFGAPASTEKKDDKPAAFSFKPVSTDASKPFSFTASAKSDATPSLPSFNFTTTTSESEKKDDKPTISFSSKPATEEKKEDTAVASTPAVKPFSFGTDSKFGGFNSSIKPTESAFNFTPPAPANGSSAAPSFNFGGSSGSSTSFSFGKSGQEDKPASIFPSTTTPSSGVFNFQFSAPTSSAAATSLTSTTTANTSNSNNNENNDDEEVVEQSDDKTDYKIASLGEKVDTVTGEEDETVEYTKRAKVMKFNVEDKANPYGNVGVGELKVLKDKTTGKSRILVRADGSFNILLNCAIAASVKYDVFGKNMVRVPMPKPDGKIETYLLRVKTATDAEELAAKINEVSK